jgi:hypothetical protein
MDTSLYPDRLNMTCVFNSVTQVDKVNVVELARNLQLKRFPGFQHLQSHYDNCVNSCEDTQHQLDKLNRGGKRSAYSEHPDQ